MIDWQPIETAPDDEPLIVFWRNEYGEACFDFEQKEDGVWLTHADNYEHFCVAAPPGSTGPHEDAPYTHWATLQAPSN